MLFRYVIYNNLIIQTYGNKASIYNIYQLVNSSHKL